ncbi:MAG: hypothetical protein ACRD3W_21905 [Terriglobales bacterium]
MGTVPTSAQDGASGKSQIVAQLQDDHGRMYDAMVARDLINFQMSPAWWTSMTASDKKGVHAVDHTSRGIYDFAKEHGWGDISSFEDNADQSGASADERQQKIQAMLNGWKDKLSVTFVAEPNTCDKQSFDLAMRYLTAVGELLDSDDFKPPSGVAHITMIASGTAKDISVTTTDGKHFTATGPVNHEPDDWGSKLTDGFERLSKNRIN